MSYFSEMSYKTDIYKTDMTRAVAYPNPAPPPYSGPCITTKNCTILNVSNINHRHRKLFNIVGGIPKRGQHQYFGEGGGYCNRYIHACMHNTHMYERMYMLLNVQTPMHACTHRCMHATYARIHLYICILI